MADDKNQNNFVDKIEKAFIQTVEENGIQNEKIIDRKDVTIFIDIDDTLRVRDKKFTEAEKNKDYYYNQIPKDAIKALYELQDQGYELCLCTGRSYASAKEMGLLDLEYEGQKIEFSGVFSNGQEFSSREGEVISAYYMKDNEVDAVLKQCNDYQYGCILSTDKGFYIINKDKMSEDSKDYLDRITRDGTTVHEGTWPLIDNEGKRINVFNFSIACDVDKEAQKPGWEQAWSKIGDLEFEVKQSDKKPGKDNRYFDVTMKDVDKGWGVEVMKSHLGTRFSIGIGDALNDGPMFDKVDYKVVMGNAIQAVKDRADFVTTSIFDKAKSGIAFLKEHLLDVAKEHFENKLILPKIYDSTKEIEQQIIREREDETHTMEVQSQQMYK